MESFNYPFELLTFVTRYKTSSITNMLTSLDSGINPKLIPACRVPFKIRKQHRLWHQN